MKTNIPNDWPIYFRICEKCGRKYHLSEGYCDCNADDDEKKEEMKPGGA